jgi:hypothetical protein
MAAPKPIALISKHSKRSKFSYLFAILVSLIVLFPYLAKPGLSTVIFRLLSALTFVAAVYAVGDKRAQWVTGLFLALPTAVLNTWFTFHPGSSALAVLSLVSTLIFLSFTLIALLGAVLRAETVTRDTIYGALSVYLLMAFVWGIAYLLLETLQPGGLSMDIARHPNHKVDWFDCMQPGNPKFSDSKNPSTADPEIAVPGFGASAQIRAEFGTVPNRWAREHSARLAPSGCTHFEKLSENQPLPMLRHHEQSLAGQVPYTRT